MLSHKFNKKIEIFEKDLINTLKTILGGKDTHIKLRSINSDRNDFVGTADEAVNYCIEKNGLKNVKKKLLPK